MKLSRIKDIFLFHIFCHLFQILFDHIVHEARAQKESEKSVQKLTKSNKSFNFGIVS